MTLSIAKTFGFSAAHRLTTLPAEHPCSRPHGHNYEVTLELSGPANDHGFVVDYRDLDSFKSCLEQLDHYDLNTAVDFEPTSEFLAIHLFAAALRLGLPVRSEEHTSELQ